MLTEFGVGAYYYLTSPMKDVTLQTQPLFSRKAMDKSPPPNVVSLSQYRRRMKLDQFNFHHILAETDGTAIIMFTKEGCSSCKAWKRLLEEYQRQHPMTAVFEVDAEKEMGLAREFDILHLPALFIYQNGHYHSSLQCAANIKILEGEIATVLLRPPQEQP